MFTKRPTDFLGRASRIISGSFADGKRSINTSKLILALKAKNEHTVYSIMSNAIETFEKSLKPKLEGVLADVQKASGIAAAKLLKTQLAQRNAATRELGFNILDTPSIKSFAFDHTDPKAVEWVKDHAAKTITGISNTTRDEIKQLVEDAFTQQFDVETLAGEIADLIGDDARAEMIARTETMDAANEGQQAAWDQAIDDGLLTGNEKQEWIVTPDDRLCPICEDVDGQTVGLDENFEVDGDEIDGPPAHPNCRCTIGLVLGD